MNSFVTPYTETSASFYYTVPLFLKDVEGFIAAEVSSVVSGWLERHRMDEGGLAGEYLGCQ